ncbi:flocculation protein FLO11 [Strongylocentrotus purpuratus]|uniref:Uncharacterized protein n=1 Tax=Strongylocentrotus purpuratus TaxID=7668 RepID=A0A7M7LIL3_STRPU|nr:flocculation protein FLO11 [Strongylocentrotus purpuratus]XP_011667162.1 flocculation protein FLO11 [Strongylocentrotus purpuratus]|eukprot:XP_001180804.2 PREDICTED: flocculation protein FLO11 [Strongylocentrotus purpuratus]
MDAMDDLDLPKAQAMPSIPVASDALPSGSNPLRRSTFPTLALPSGGLKVPLKPGRYETEVDTAPLTPPSSSHNLQLVFDSGKIYDNHPRKYRLLLETDKDKSGHSKNLSLSASSATDAAPTKTPPPSVTVQDGQVVAMGTMTSGPATGPSPTPDAAAAAATPKSFTTSATGGAPFTLSEAISSVAVKKEPGGSRYVPQEFLHTFKAATTLGPTSDQKSQQRAGTSSSAEMPRSSGKPSTGMVQRSNAPISKICTQERTDVPCGSCAVVQPEPRRLFGFGPFYRPLPETVCATEGRRQSSPTFHVPSELSEAVDREGITGAGYSGSRKSSRAAVDSTDSGAAAKGADGHKKLSPTPAELNAWLGGSF